MPRSAVFFLAGLLLLPTPILALPSDEDSKPESKASTESKDEPANGTLVERVTVSTTRSSRAVKDTAGNTSVVTAEEVDRRLAKDIADLLRYEPGIYAEGDLTRLGLSGFNIRGIGGNRVRTQIDGIPVGEVFGFGPIAATQNSLEVGQLQDVELVRSAGSSLYGSDAVGGLVSFATKDPADYLESKDRYLQLKTGFDTRDEQFMQSVTGAWRARKAEYSLNITARQGNEFDNAGLVESTDSTRTAPNPQKRDSINALGKVVFSGKRSRWEFGLEVSQRENEVELLSSRGFSPLLGTNRIDFDTEDQQNRTRLSVEQELFAESGWFDSLLWRAYVADADTDQTTTILTDNGVATGESGDLLGISRQRGSFKFEQQTLGGEIQLRKTFGSKNIRQTLTWGAQVIADRFDMVRDRAEFSTETGDAVPTSLVIPTKYFPETDVTELGLYLQDEISLLSGRWVLTPGVRLDSFENDPSSTDQVFLDGNPGQSNPVGSDDAKVTFKLGTVVDATPWMALHAQLAQGFRAPPYSDVNNGFTNFNGGYQTLPNPNLDPETSDNIEAGVRLFAQDASLSVTLFRNDFDDFIDLANVGFDPFAGPFGVVQFQPRNIEELRIEGVEAAGDVRLSSSFQVRFAYSHTNSESPTAEDQPALSIAPDRLVLGAITRTADNRLGGELTTTLTARRRQGEVRSGSDQFRPDSYFVVDLSGYYRINDNLKLRAGVFNATDEKYWAWENVIGRSATDPIIDRFSSPGINGAVQLEIQF